MAPQSPTYDLLITVHRGHNIPIGDLNDFSCDPFCVLTLHPAHPSASPSPPQRPHPDNPNAKGHPQPKPQPIQFRTPTIRRSLEPEWQAEWIVGGVSESGVRLDVEVRDEDPGDHDDIMGLASMTFPLPESTPDASPAASDSPARSGAGTALCPGLEVRELELKILKRKGSARSHAATYLAEMVSSKVSRHGRVFVSLRVLRRSENTQEGVGGMGGMYTLGPHHWTEHFSPLLGHVTGTKPGIDALHPFTAHPRQYDFKANQLQLAGPLPRALKFQYVAYRPFVGLLFSRKGIRGMVLNRALKKQHDIVYSYNRTTKYGVVPLPPLEEDVKGEEKPRAQAEESVHESSTTNGTTAPIDPTASSTPNGRAQPEDSANGPNKTNGTTAPTDPTASSAPNGHTPTHAPTPSTSSSPAHSLAHRLLQMTSFGRGGRLFTYVLMLDGQWRFTETGEEFAVQFLSKHSMHSGVAEWVAWAGEFFVRRIGGGDGQTAEEDDDDEDPAHYELVIDNDSGTYRPNKAQLGDLRAFLAAERNLAALGKVTVMDGFDETLKGWKDALKKEKEAAKEGKGKEGKKEGKEGGAEDGEANGEAKAAEGQGEGEGDGAGEEHPRLGAIKARVVGKAMRKVESRTT